MKNGLIKFVISLVVGMCVCSCGLFKCFNKQQQQQTDANLGTPAMYGYTMTITNHQLDSICLVDALSRDLDDWLSTVYVDNETGATINRYAFIKTLEEDDELIYILTPVDTLYKITKRIVKPEEE